jgi:hypothetical protein
LRLRRRTKLRNQPRDALSHPRLAPVCFLFRDPALTFRFPDALDCLLPLQLNVVRLRLSLESSVLRNRLTLEPRVFRRRSTSSLTVKMPLIHPPKRFRPHELRGMGKSLLRGHVRSQTGSELRLSLCRLLRLLLLLHLAQQAHQTAGLLKLVQALLLVRLLRRKVAREEWDVLESGHI